MVSPPDTLPIWKTTLSIQGKAKWKMVALIHRCTWGRRVPKVFLYTLPKWWGLHDGFHIRGVCVLILCFIMKFSSLIAKKLPNSIIIDSGLHIEFKLVKLHLFWNSDLAILGWEYNFEAIQLSVFDVFQILYFACVELFLIGYLSTKKAFRQKAPFY
jgi:hypothetical protein